MFTATWLQAATYLLAVCPFSIAFLVFLNSSVSFVVTDLIHVDHGIGDVVGTLGFADELLALIACPFWGVLSDRIGVRTVCFIAYLLIALALVVFVQCKNVYPQLLLARLLFSLGGAAATTMVTAVLPTMSAKLKPEKDKDEATDDYLDGTLNSRGGNVAITENRRLSQAPSVSASSELTITPALYQSGHARNAEAEQGKLSSGDAVTRSSSQIAGFVGMCAGFGALLALLLFLPLPERFQRNGHSPESSIKYSYYIVAVVASFAAVWCLVGLRGLHEDGVKPATPLRSILYGRKPDSNFDNLPLTQPLAGFRNAILLGFRRADIGLGYVGGFVARASSVAISLFVPLLVNSLFMSSRLCSPNPDGHVGGLPELKKECSQAYILAAELTGISQLVALLCAPLFGYASAKFGQRQGPLILAASAGILGYTLLATRFAIDMDKQRPNAEAFVSVCLIGVSQMGAIVCSLGLLSGGVLKQERTDAQNGNPPRTSESGEEGQDTLDDRMDDAPLIAKVPSNDAKDLSEMKGSIAGIYSLYGGAAILLLTKLGGFLFDRVSFGAPFYIMAIFNAILLLVCVFATFRSRHGPQQIR